jgi:hypothetical protein
MFLVLGGCRGKLLATAHLASPGTAEVHFRPAKGLQLWSDYDGEWTGNHNAKMPIKYDIDVIQNGKSLGKIACNAETASTSVCGSSTTMNSDHTGNCEVKLDCSLPTLGPSEVTLKVTGRVDSSRVRRVTNMSLNVREG